MPHWSINFWPFWVNFPTPKSHILTMLFKSNKIFSNFISRWTIPLLWIYLIPWINCRYNILAVFSHNFLLFFTKFCKFPPEIYSIIINIYLSVSNVSNIFVTEGWYNPLIKFVSYNIFLLAFSFDKFCLLNDLIATILPVKIFNPILTFPKAPLPITLPNL